MYKDKDKQREANKRIQAKRRAKGVTQGVIESGCDKGVTVTKADSHVDASDIGVVKALHQAISKPKRGKDIKCFGDLPVDVQDTIVKMSTIDGKMDEDEKAKRTLAAIKYQHLFPDRYESTDAVCTGVVTGKPGDEDYNGICTSEWRAERGR